MDVCEGMDTVFMCAAVTSGAKDIVERPLKHVTDNIVMNACMLRAAWDAGVRDFLFVSSGAAYPEFGGDALSESDFWVHGELHPAYRWVGTMKRQAEELCLLYAEMGMRMTIIRPSNVYGPGDNFDPDTSHVTAAMVRKFAEAGDGGTVEVWGDGLDERDLIYVDDFARAALLAWAWTDGYQAINVASGATVSVEGILMALEEMTGHQMGRLYRKEKPRTARSRSFDVSRLQSLGFEPEVMLGYGLLRTLRWYSTQIGGDAWKF
jgi:GDP-L-fucose synthase